VFTESDFLENGVVGVAFDNPDLTIMNDYTFDWLNIGKKLTITKVVKNRVYTIDGMSAVDVYAKYLGKEIAERLPAIGIEFPLILDRRGTKIARAVLQAHEDGSLSFAGNMNEGERVQFGLGNAELILRSSSKLGEKFRDKSVESIFVYSCMARRRFMAESIPLEIAPLQAVANTAGFFTYGEFFHIDACNELLNETMTVVALSENAGKAQRSKPAKKESKQEDDYFYTIKALSHLVDATSTELETLNSNLEKEVRKKAEEIQTSQQAYLEGYKHIIDHVPIAIWMGDSDNKAIYANALFCGLSGYRLEEIIGKVSHNFWTLKSIACTYPKHMGVRYEEENLIHEGEFLSQDGRIIPMRLTVIPVANGGSVWMMVDMREYRALEDQKKHLEDINKIKDDFINIASHELRTPLTSIKGYLSMMLDEDFGELPDDIRRVSGIMLESSNRLISMIGDMLDSAKLESGNMFFRHDTFSVASVLTSVYDEFKSVSAQS
jgi:PAS domain S-box-containing protein